EPAGMIDMRVAQHDRVDLVDRHRERRAVLLLVVLAALDLPALEQQRMPRRAEQITRAGHAAGGAKKLELHRSFRFGKGVSMRSGASRCSRTIRRCADRRLPRPRSGKLASYANVDGTRRI